MTAMLTNLRNINEIGGNASAPNIKESKKVANERGVMGVKIHNGACDGRRHL
jgi:hypothetical protein